MLKTLLIGASALALTAGVALAQPTPLNIDGPVGPYGNHLSTPNMNSAQNSANNPASSGSGDTSERATAESGSIGAPTSVNFVQGIACSSPAAICYQDGNAAGIEQDGSGNDAVVTQNLGSQGYAVVLQEGNDNDATVDQDDSGGGTSMNRAFIGQVSDSSAATAANTARIDQVHSGNQSNFNYASILQGGFPGSQNGQNNDAEVNQTGNGHQALIRQGAEGDGSGVAEAINNVSRITQTGVNQRAINQQEGYASSQIDQAGDGNSALVLQDYEFSTATQNVFSRVDQNGNNNFAAVQQDGENVDSFIEQDGSDNQAFVYQNEIGPGAEADVKQDGIGNYASVRQEAVGSNLEADVFQLGNNNEAYVNQNFSTNGMANVSQTGNGNFGQITQ